MRTLTLTLMIALAFITIPSAQQTDPLKSAASTLGADKINSLQFTASGSSFTVGQAYEAGGPWPRLNVDSYTGIFDYDAGRMRLEIARSVPDPVPPGVAPFQGQQRQVQALSGEYGWNIPQPPPG